MSLSRHSLRYCRSQPSFRLLGSRPFSSTVARRNELQEDQPQPPRWTQTPPRMKAPFSLNTPKKPERSVWIVNEDPEKLDRFYERLLGSHLTKSMPEELKWLAVTHKSFDNGRRGFNTKLAYYGESLYGPRSFSHGTSMPEESHVD